VTPSRLLKKVYGITSSQWGIDPRRFVRALTRLPRFFSGYRRFRAGYAGRMEIFPCLHDSSEEGASLSGEYFWQDLYVAQKIFAARPGKHVDVGSRVDGFVAHVASFRELEVFDIRPITLELPNVIFRQADFMNLDGVIPDYCDSLSCLHALEHFGLGRYGDEIDPRGYEAGIHNMSRMLSSGGTFYLSVPVGIERVEFNAHRVFDPETILQTARSNQLFLKAFALYSVTTGLVELDPTVEALSALSKTRYGLGIFTFAKG
jgi:hypothetical protein